MALFSTIALAAVAAAGIGSAIHQGEQSKRGQKRALTRQQEVQRQAESAAISQQRKSQQEFARANRKQPDVGALLASEQALSTRGPASTLLTGPGGIDPQRLRLGRNSLLGS